MHVPIRVLNVLGIPLKMRTRRKLRELLHKCRKTADTQERVLQKILALNAPSRFSRERGLSPRMSVAEYRRAMPIGTYDQFAPYINELREGRFDALLGPHNRLLMFALSSGTTSESKFIPITRRFIDDYRRGWAMWGIRAVDEHPGLDRGHILQFTSSENRFQTPAGTPCGNISGLVTAMQNRLVRLLYTLPREIASVAHPDAKYYLVARLAAADPIIRWITTANPATLVQISRVFARHAESIIRDIRNGAAVSPFPVSDEESRRLHPYYSRPNPQRAKQLDAIAERTGRLRPADIWPELMLLSVWTGGSAGAYLGQVREQYGDIPIRDHGLHASEGRMTIPLADGTPAGLLDIASHFFEFIPEEEIDSPQPTVLLAHELEAGRNYFILLTTPSGLYRYDIHDVVRCVGFRDACPMLEFLHKGASISSITGEKIAESQVVSACRTASEALGHPLPQFSLAAKWGDPPGYELMIEHSDVSRGGDWNAFVHRVDGELQQLNCEYEEKRRTSRLSPISLQILPDGAWSSLSRERTQRAGASIEQYKHPCLIPDLKFLPRFLGHLAEQTSAESTRVGG